MKKSERKVLEEKISKIETNSNEAKKVVSEGIENLEKESPTDVNNQLENGKEQFLISPKVGKGNHHQSRRRRHAKRKWMKWKDDTRTTSSSVT